jgi:hypothetical protein
MLEVEKGKLQALALPVLGTVHGSFSTGRFVELLCDALTRKPLTSLKRLWLIGAEESIIRDIERISA